MTERAQMNDMHDAKRERLEARVSADQKALIQRAAALQGRSQSDFIVDSVVRAAEQAIRDHTVIQLSERDSRAFAEALLTPAEPNDSLRAAFARYKQEAEER